MNLTFEVTENGYKILDGGRVWIVQDGFIPFPSKTLAESAQLHIDDIIKANIPGEPVPSQEDEIKALKEQQLLMQKAIDDLIMGGAL